MKKIFIIAGEASGDYLAGRLMEDLQALCDDSIEFFGIGGPCMEKAGLKKLFSINELSIMGIVEVIGKIFHVKRLIDKTVDAVFDYNPDVIITIDSSGFTHRVDKKIKARAIRGVAPRTFSFASSTSEKALARVSQTLQAPIIHYVAPPVWAWRGRRAKSMHKFIDKLLVLLPFEPELFNKHGLETVFVGHPIALDPDFEKPEKHLIENFKKSLDLLEKSSDDRLLAESTIFEDFLDRRDVGSDNDKTRVPQAPTTKTPNRGRLCNIVLLPGSRMAEISKHLPILEEFADLMVEKYGHVRFLIPTTESMEKIIELGTRNWRQRPVIIKEKSEKVLAYYASDLAVAASGTVTLELARTGLPAVIIYKVSFITYLIVKFLVKIENACLINIIAKQNVVPELLQNNCTPQNIFHHVVSILEDTKKADEQKRMFAKVMDMLSVKERYVAAREVLKTLSCEVIDKYTTFT
ncbi:lipid-A-disaccharide synthase [Alphaproteobacteria bacterium]|nr:lipid-A-disaccharide synthase [Alphaproteobacteria bacterium]